MVTGLSSRVGRLNPSWTQAATDEDRMERFEKAVALTGEEFLSIANQYHKVSLTGEFPSYPVLMVWWVMYTELVSWPCHRGKCSEGTKGD